MYKKYLLKCEEFVGIDIQDTDSWESKEYYFDTEKEMIDFVKNKWSFSIKIEAAFKMEKLDNDIFNR